MIYTESYQVSMNVRLGSKVTVAVVLLILLAGCSAVDEVDNAEQLEPSQTERGETTPAFESTQIPPDQQTPSPNTNAEQASTTSTQGSTGATEAEPSGATTTPEPEPNVQPIYAAARHPDDSGESTITFESGKTIQGSDIASYLAQNVNDTRELYGYPALVWHEPLASSGRAHAADMFHREYFEHENPEGERAWDRYEKTGYERCVVHGENNYRMTLGYNRSGYEDMGASEIERYLAGQINSGFRRSNEGHREMMLKPQVTHLGKDAADKSRKGRPYEIHVVEQFCVPESLRSVAEDRQQTYEKPDPNPDMTPTPVPLPGNTETPTQTATPMSTASPTTTPEPTMTPDPDEPDVQFDFSYDPATEELTITHAGGDTIRDSVTQHIQVVRMGESTLTFWASDEFAAHGEFPISPGDSLTISASPDQRIRVTWTSTDNIGFPIAETTT